MAKQPTKVDRALLERSIKAVESSDDPPGSLSELYEQVAVEYNSHNPPKCLSHAVVKLRIEEWKLSIKTKAAKRGAGGKASKTFDGPGQGRKQCSKCGQYVAGLHSECVCGSTDFNTNGTASPKGGTVYDKPGRGRKECAKCHKYVGFKASICPNCDSSNFVKRESKPKASKAKEPKVIKTFDEPGRGRKECAKCHKYVAGVQSHCACGSTDFVRKAPVDEIKTYDGPGRMRKQCPECKTYLGYKAEKCVCGYEFDADSVVPAPKVTTYDEDGPRRKQCPECEVYVGRSAEQCICGHKFQPEETPAPKVSWYDRPTDRDIEASQHWHRCGCGMVNILAPAGAPAVKLNGTDEETVLDWAEKMIAAGHDRKVHYSPGALRYFVANYFFERNGDEYRLVCEHLASLASVPSAADDWQEEPEEEELAVA